MRKTVHQQAQQKVTKALSVFHQAIVEVEKAQEILLKGVTDDSFQIHALEVQIESIKNRIEELEVERTAKGVELEKNNELLTRLNEFQA